MYAKATCFMSKLVHCFYIIQIEKISNLLFFAILIIIEALQKKKNLKKMKVIQIQFICAGQFRKGQVFENNI